jgi:predicted Zn finger-like uncharacterized protein
MPMPKAAMPIFNFVVGRNKKDSHGDPTREVFETVVFVVVLVLMLKLFVAEAFVIPTGSMAGTLWGDQVVATCPDCGSEFAVTANQNNIHIKPAGVSCQNCGHLFNPKNADNWSSGDRVLVSKYQYHIKPPKRFDVVVFKYPEEPYSVKDKAAMNYIKRLVGLPGETLAIFNGDLYTSKSINYPPLAPNTDPKNLWQREYTYNDHPEAVNAFQQGLFDMVRKSPDQILAVMRPVFDLDKQPASLSGIAKTRWHPAPADAAGWEQLDKGFKHTSADFGWVRYQHVRPGWDTADKAIQPRLICDHLSYNLAYYPPEKPNSDFDGYWVSDLIVSVDAVFQGEDDTLVLELSRQSTRYQAVVTPTSCKIYKFAEGSPKPELLAEKSLTIKPGSKTSLRFANVDCRLTVWVGGKALDFGAAADYTPVTNEIASPTKIDLEEPARIGAKGDVAVSKVQLHRDVHYTCYWRGNNNRDCAVATYYIQPGHYLCLGDNSSSSKDSRDWGTVPERLMLGRADVVYWPWYRVGLIK